MSYSYFDANGDLGQGPNSSGRDLLDTWAQDNELPLTQKFLEDGETENPAALAAELDKADMTGAPPLPRLIDALFTAASQAEDILIMSED